MKKVFLLLSILFSIFSFAYTQENSKNDVIISSNSTPEGKFTRYFHVQNFQGFEKSYSAYKNPDGKEFIFDLPDQSFLKILEIEVQNFGESEKTWYKIQYNNQTGWIQTDFNPYSKGNWTIIGTEKGKDKEFTLRKMEKKFLTSPDKESPVCLYEKPDFSSNLLATISEQKAVETLAITEEFEQIQWGKRKKSEYWVKIIYNNQEGWIFGAYLDSGMGGPKYPVPEKIICWNLECGGV